MRELAPSLNLWVYDMEILWSVTTQKEAPRSSLLFLLQTQICLIFFHPCCPIFVSINPKYPDNIHFKTLKTLCCLLVIPDSHHSMCRCCCSPESGPGGCAAQRARVGSWELSGRSPPPGCQDSPAGGDQMGSQQSNGPPIKRRAIERSSIFKSFVFSV